MMRNILKKGFLSIELVIIGSMILMVAGWLIFKRYPGFVQDTTNAINGEITRFDNLPEGVNRIVG